MIFNRKPVVDKFAKERALYQAMNKGKDSDMTSFEMIKTLLEERGLLPVPQPEKGKDYFTEEEIEAIKADLLSRIVVPEAEKVDYEALHAYIGSLVVEHFSKLRQPKDGEPGKKGDPGEPGKDAVLDMDALVQSVIKKLPKSKPEKSVTLKEVKDFIEEEIKKIPAQPVRIGGSVASIRALTDVDISRVPTDAKGNYIFNRYNLTVGFDEPASPQLYDLWVDMN